MYNHHRMTSKAAALYELDLFLEWLAEHHPKLAKTYSENVDPPMIKNSKMTINNNNEISLADRQEMIRLVKVYYNTRKIDSG